jgi:enoyl-CoA hydratase/carnithine racemase
MAFEYQQLGVRRESPALWRVTFDNPPINMVDLQTLRELEALASELEASGEVKVIVFDSADRDFFLAHWDISSPAPAAGARPSPSWIDISARLAQQPVASIAVIRGRARGMGSEIALGCDMRFASVERAIFGQMEVGVGLIPGGGAMERLPLLVGRARALEIILGAGDFDATTAERYGWINRALPDVQLDAFVTDLAQRLASFDRTAIAEAKRLLNRHLLPDADDQNDSKTTFHRAFSWPGTQARTRKLVELGIGTRGDLEMHFGDYLPRLAEE